MHPSSGAKKASLSQLPLEIKQRIVHHVVMQTEKRHTYFHKPLPLSLVDRKFYELCRPFEWNELSLPCQAIPNLEKFIHQSLPRQANHVRSILIGVHEQPPSHSDGIFPRKQLCHILKVCTNLTKLNIRLECAAWLDQFGNLIIDPVHRPMSTLLQPISQLSNITYLTLDNLNGHRCMFDEQFLVRILRNLVHLVSLRINKVGTSFPTCDFDDQPPVQPLVSPLAIHLASLSSLKFIHFSYMHCFDSGWSTIKWKGALEGITLRKSMVSLRAVHAFCSLFEDSLVYLSLYLVPVNKTPTYEIPESDRGCVFRLPRLKRLSVYNKYIIPFLRLFRESPNITRISIIYYSSLKGIVDLINRADPTWINLKSLLVHGRRWQFSRDAISDLIKQGAEAGVKVECGILKKVRQPFFEEDEFSTESDSVEESDEEIESQDKHQDVGQISDCYKSP
ncbi:hypothetical protein PTTG_29495 [Puccinia triticina 1-1 BBBD Race 1]|uniref:F-box domain-containing protein n=2 Tax=Puccinia triticina TaxID=208348 RepID=A0A180G3W4_PUCT1|nr:uncharacterized protein PtA15_1A467 [Puccinia triticina]OAV87288.1 hypothetical protein PTTG_29495 [Puccinia triticina 1-1 BBBD Race 1]WAQ81128.1 hypothetical protein PtA15_1A467 [Puccinia triticina]